MLIMELFHGEYNWIVEWLDSFLQKITVKMIVSFLFFTMHVKIVRFKRVHSINGNRSYMPHKSFISKEKKSKIYFIIIFFNLSFVKILSKNLCLSNWQHLLVFHEILILKLFIQNRASDLCLGIFTYFLQRKWWHVQIFKRNVQIHIGKLNLHYKRKFLIYFLWCYF